MTKIFDLYNVISPQSDEQASLKYLCSILQTDQIVRLMGPDGTIIPLPPSVLQAMRQTITHLAQGAHVQVTAIPEELTPQQAADFLNTTRQNVLKLIADGLLLATNDGTRCRIRFADVVLYQQHQAERTRRAIDEIARLSQESGNYH